MSSLIDGKPQNILDALKACGNAKNVAKGRMLHAAYIGSADNADIYVENTLVAMYAKCRSMSEAFEVFQKMQHRTTVSWNALIFGYADNGDGEVALQLFLRMQREGYQPNELTFVAALKACASLATHEKGVLKTRSCSYGIAVHSLAVERGACLELRLGNTLMNMYARCGCMVDAQRVLARMRSLDVISWNVLMFGYAENGEGEKALDTFARMQRQGYVPNSLSFIAALKACIVLSTNEELVQAEQPSVKMVSLERGLDIHSQLAANPGFRSDICIGSTLIDMYGKCGSIPDARSAFNAMRHRDVVSWNAMLFGYAENGEGWKALDLFFCITCGPNALTFIAALKACSSVGALDVGTKLHAQICSTSDFPRCENVSGEFYHGLDSPVSLGNALVDFYGKCGCMANAREVFDSLGRLRDLVTWNALMTGYSREGNAELVLELFHRMLDEQLKPSSVTFLCVLAACCHAGLVVQGREHFDAMPRRFGISPQLEHYACMVDILARANELGNALALIKQMPLQPDAAVWTALLDGCRKWQNLGIGKLAFEALVSLEDSGAVLLANIYGSKNPKM